MTIVVHILRGNQIDTVMVDTVSRSANGTELLLELDGEEVGRYFLDKIDGWLHDSALADGWREDDSALASRDEDEG